MSPFRHYINSNDPSPFMGLLKKLSFNAGQMNELTGGVTRLRGRSKDGEVELMRVGDIEHVTIYPTVSGAWEIALVYPSPLTVSGPVTLHFELKKGGSQYYCDVRLSSSERKTFPVYIYPGTGVSTTMFIQASDVIFTSTLISCQLSIWENHGTLGEEQTTGPTVVTGMTWVCNYSHDAEFSSTDYYPLNGYIVPKTYENWMAFVADAWMENLGKYSVDVTMVKTSGDFVNSATLEYLNNGTGITYSPSGEATTSLAPLTSLKDDYTYSGNLYNYINYFNNSISVDSTGLLTNIHNDYYILDSGVTTHHVEDQSQNVELSIITTYHQGLYKPGGGYYYPDTDSYTEGAGTYHWTNYRFDSAEGEYATQNDDWETTPYSQFDTSATELLYTNENTVNNDLSIDAPSSISSVLTLDYITDSGQFHIYGTYNRITYLTETKAISVTPTQLPLKNARKLASNYLAARAIAYSADTSGSGGSGGS